METTKNQTAVTYTSVLITFILLLTVLVVHLAFYTVIFTAIRKVKALALNLFVYKQQYHMQTRHTRLPTDDDNQPLITHSIVELPPRPYPQALEQAETGAKITEEHIQSTSPNVLAGDM